MAYGITATHDAERGVLAIAWHGETREFKAALVAGRYVVAFRVFAGRFKTGTKLWPLGVTYWPDSGELIVEQGGYSNCRGARHLVGWWDDASPLATRHRGRC